MKTSHCSNAGDMIRVRMIRSSKAGGVGCEADERASTSEKSDAPPMTNFRWMVLSDSDNRVKAECKSK